MNEEGLSTHAVARRTVSSSFFQIGAQAITLVTGFTRSVILARLLAPQDFGLVALALIFANLAWNITAMGIDSRLVQKPTMDPVGLSTHLALRLLLAALAFLILVAAIPLLKVAYPNYAGLTSAVLAYGALNVLKSFNLTPFVLLKRRLAFRRLSLIAVVSSLVMLVTAPSLAWAGWGFWSLVIGEALAGTLVSTLGLWLIRRPMRFSLSLDRERAKDYFGFGKYVMLTHQLGFALDKFDDFWAGTALGEVALGYYHKAYEFATYPRKVISRPVQDVFFAAYARLQHDRLGLSKAFFRANAYVVRMGFFFSTVLILIAPEFVKYVLGDKWLPMVSTFQLMIIYCLFDPLLVTAGNLLTACGAPQKMTRVRLAQLLFFVPAVIAGASIWQINGIAIAADGMLVIGLLLVHWLTRSYVDISLRKLFVAPVLGLTLGGAVVVGIAVLSKKPIAALGAASYSVLWAIVKGLAFSIPYVAVLLLLEWRDYRASLQSMNRMIGFSRRLHWPWSGLVGEKRDALTLNPDILARIDGLPAIVLGVTWANGLGLIRSLGQAGVPVVALDPKPQAIGFSSRYVTGALVCPDAGEEEGAFLDFMDRLGQKLPQPGVLFLTRDQDVSAVSRNRARLERHFRIPFADWQVLSRIVDKRGQYAVALDVGVPLPETFFPGDEAEAALAARKAPYPAIIKPAYHVRFSERFGGVKGFVANSPEEALAHYQKGTAHGYQMMIQEVIPGEPELLYTFGSYLNRQGEPLAQFTGRKIRQHPRVFGTCRLGECCPAPEVAELALRLLHALGFWGVSQVEFKLDPRDGQFKLMEVNARNYQWQHLATVCGANLAYAAYQDAVGEAVVPTEASAYGRKWVLAASDLVLAPGEFLRGQTQPGRWLQSWRGVAVDGLFSWRDPRPGLRYLRHQVARWMGDGS